MRRLRRTLIETLAKSEGLVEALALVAAALFCAVLYLLASCGVYVSHWCRDWDPNARAVSRLRRVRAALGRLGSRLRSSFRIRRSSSSPRSDAEADLQGIEVKFPRTVCAPRGSRRSECTGGPRRRCVDFEECLSLI